jgi:large subunit ribosomal protein L13
VDVGDHVIVVNAEKARLTGKKLDQKIYYWHTGYPGGIKSRTAGEVLTGKHPQRVVEKAVERMMPKESPLARKQMAKLRVYAGPEHPHEAQKPETIDFKAKNRKNSRIG